ncbi:g180 [Yersinia phage phiR1-37]|nr:hypothetical protein phiR1-37_gp180 [Yersinia phage phiR1-37]CCE26204.1 g180 [Yersinia phage phiR1-37]
MFKNYMDWEISSEAYTIKQLIKDYKWYKCVQRLSKVSIHCIE